MIRRVSYRDLYPETHTYLLLDTRTRYDGEAWAQSARL